MAARGLHHAKNELGEFYRRMRGKLGGATASMATPHQLARIVYTVLTIKKAYRPQLHAQTNKAILPGPLNTAVQTSENLKFNQFLYNNLQEIKGNYPPNSFAVLGQADS